MLPPTWELLEKGKSASPYPIPSGYDRYPTSDDLSAFLADAGIAPSDFRLQASVASGIDEVEKKCFRHFLAGRNTDNSVQQPYPRVFDPPVDPVQGDWGAMLDLGPFGDLARIDSVLYAPFGSTTAQVWQAGRDYRPMPPNALAQGRPITWLETGRWWWSPASRGYWGSVTVSGLWGYSTRIPPMAWDAMLSASALNLFAGQFRGAGVPLGIKRWVGPDGISTEYDASMLTARLSQWEGDVQKAVESYGRWSLV